MLIIIGPLYWPLKYNLFKHWCFYNIKFTLYTKMYNVKSTFQRKSESCFLKFLNLWILDRRNEQPFAHTARIPSRPGTNLQVLFPSPVFLPPQAPPLPQRWCLPWLALLSPPRTPGAGEGTSLLPVALNKQQPGQLWDSQTRAFGSLEPTQIAPGWFETKWCGKLRSWHR